MLTFSKLIRVWFGSIIGVGTVNQFWCDLVNVVADTTDDGQDWKKIPYLSLDCLHWLAAIVRQSHTPWPLIVDRSITSLVAPDS